MVECLWYLPGRKEVLCAVMKQNVMAAMVCCVAVIALSCATAEKLANRKVDVDFNNAIATADFNAAAKYLEQGADINARFRLTGGQTTLIMVAGAERFSEGMRFLLDHGADPNIASKKGRTALMNAAEHGRVEHVAILLEAGADHTLKAADGATALSLAKESRYEGVVTVLEQHRDRPADG